MPTPMAKTLTATFSDNDNKELTKALKELEAKIKVMKEGKKIFNPALNLFFFTLIS
jgi:hypothetical protein